MPTKRMSDYMEHREEFKLKWPEGWERTRIDARKTMAAWKKSGKEYIAALYKELERMGCAEVMLTFNPPGMDRTDPGVAVYFSMQRHQDYSWQEALGLDSPAPTLDEIDDAFKRKAMPYHPDRNPAGTETWLMYRKHRDNAKAWVLGTEKQEHEYVIPCDRFNEVRLNIAGLKKAIAALRALDAVGVPGMLQRSFKGFRTALPAHQSDAVKEAITL